MGNKTIFYRLDSFTVPRSWSNENTDSTNSNPQIFKEGLGLFLPQAFQLHVNLVYITSPPS